MRFSKKSIYESESFKVFWIISLEKNFRCDFRKTFGPFYMIFAFLLSWHLQSQNNILMISIISGKISMRFSSFDMSLQIFAKLP